MGRKIDMYSELGKYKDFFMKYIGLLSNRLGYVNLIYTCKNMNP